MVDSRPRIRLRVPSGHPRPIYTSFPCVSQPLSAPLIRIGSLARPSPLIVHAERDGLANLNPGSVAGPPPQRRRHQPLFDRNRGSDELTSRES
jgi:hypothetical protein